MQVMPSDQTSTLPSYWPSSMARITSGAILTADHSRRKQHAVMWLRHPARPRLFSSYYKFIWKQVFSDQHWSHKFLQTMRINNSKVQPNQAPNPSDHKQEQALKTNNPPVRRPHKRVGWSHDGSRTEVAQFDLTGLRQQDVSCFHIPAATQSNSEQFSHIWSVRVWRATIWKVEWCKCCFSQ